MLDSGLLPVSPGALALLPFGKTHHSRLLPGFYGGGLTLIRGPFVVMCGLFVLVGDPLPLAGNAVALVGERLAPIRPALTLLGHPRALAHEACALRELTSPRTIAAEPRALALKGCPIDPELERVPLHLGARAVMRDPSTQSGEFEVAVPRPLQLTPIHLKLRRLALDRRAAALTLSPLNLTARLQPRRRGLMAS
jgi:hypothetical protein